MRPLKRTNLKFLTVKALSYKQGKTKTRKRKNNDNPENTYAVWYNTLKN